MRESSLNFNRRSPLTERAQLTLSRREKKKERERNKNRALREFSLCSRMFVDTESPCWWRLLWRLVFDVIHCARRIFCRFCSDNHVAKDAGICKWTVLRGTVYGSSCCRNSDWINSMWFFYRLRRHTFFLYVYYMIIISRIFEFDYFLKNI